ncbi:hypothetical protein CRENBAI_006056 [Crenichthys baileyi]|uniref:Uncharacterized protein n=1 Tax=Crenichthys baileyi TaxID=28760 RepID=A0AAV9SCE6_9TELE
MNEPPPHPDPVPGPVPEGFLDEPPPHPICRRSPRPCRTSQRSSELHHGFSWSYHQPSDHQPLRRRPADRLPLRRRPADRRICRGGHWSGDLNSGYAGVGFRASRLNPCPPSEAPSARPGRIEFPAETLSLRCRVEQFSRSEGRTTGPHHRGYSCDV